MLQRVADVRGEYVRRDQVGNKEVCYHGLTTPVTLTGVKGSTGGLNTTIFEKYTRPNRFDPLTAKNELLSTLGITTSACVFVPTSVETTSQFVNAAAKVADQWTRNVRFVLNLS